MDLLIEMVTKKLLWVDYGQIEGFYDAEDIGLADLLAVRAALDIAIEEKREAELTKQRNRE
jgi:hypothetical protein